MAKSVNRLTPTRVAKLKWVGPTKTNYHPDGDGLYLQVAIGDTKSWIFRFKRNGRVRDMGLGPVRDVDLAEARELARQYRGQLRDGFDPIEVRRQRRLQNQLDASRSMTFDAAASAYIEAHSPGWRNPKHRQQWTNTLATYASPIFGSVPVASIDTGLVLRALKPIWTGKAETAGRVRGRIEAVLGWSTTMGYRAGDNPARWNTHLENLLPKKAKVHRVAHHAAMPYAEVPDFMGALRGQDGLAARALELTILTAVRTSDALGARWSEVDFAGGVWSIPAERMKSGVEHRVPLPKLAVDILKELHETRRSEFVFPGLKPRKPLSNMSMLMLLRRMGRADLTTHGFRSSFRDWVAEQTSFPRELAEKALAHAIKDKAEAAYQRGDLLERRRQMMEAWAAYCEGEGAGNVVALRTAKQ
jgi:integrase